MTKKQLEIKERLETLANKGYGTIENGMVEGKAEKKKVALFFNGDEFIKFVVSDGDNLNDKELKPNQVVKAYNTVVSLENEVERIENMKRWMEEQRKFHQECEAKMEARRNALETYKNSYFDDILNEEDNEKYKGVKNNILRNYREGRNSGFPFLDINDIYFYSDDAVNEIVGFLEEAGVAELGVSDQSTASLEFIKLLTRKGWKVTGSYELTRYIEYSERTQETFGIKLTKIQ